MTNSNPEPRSTACGLAAIAIWSTNIACSRLLAEKLGIYHTGTMLFILAGFGGIAYSLVVSRNFRSMLKLPAKYLYGCGGLFVIYMLSLYLAVGFSSDKRQVIEVGLVNYLWPALTLLLSVPFFRQKARYLPLVLGALIALGGVFLASTGEQTLTLSGMILRIKSNPLPYALGVSAALCWALYSNLCKLWSGAVKISGVPLFSLATGICFLCLTPLAEAKAINMDLTVMWLLLYMALVPTLAAYILWEVSMQRGNLTLVVVASYSIPVLSTVFSCLVFSESADQGLLVGSLLVVTGAVVCKLSVTQSREDISQACPVLQDE